MITSSEETLGPAPSVVRFVFIWREVYKVWLTDPILVHSISKLYTNDVMDRKWHSMELRWINPVDRQRRVLRGAELPRVQIWEKQKKKSGGAVSVHTAVDLTWNVYIFQYLQSLVKIYFSIQKYDLNISIRHYNKIFLSQLREL